MSTNTEISNAAAALGRKGGSAKSEAKTTTARANGAKGGRPTIKPGHSQKNIAAVRRWWKQHRNIWEISQLTGLSTALVTEIQADHL
jgi:hypothetical protein